MAYNKAKEEYRWNQWKAEEEKILREQGVDEETIQKLADVLRRKEKEYGHAIYLIADEPYREIVYEGVEVPYVPNYYENTFVCYS